MLQEIIAGEKHTLYYFSGEKSVYETDFVIQQGKNIIPIDVKAVQNLRFKSLKYYYEKFKPAFAVRTSMANAVDEGWLVNISLWAIGAL